MVVVIPKQKNIIINCGLYKNFRYIKKTMLKYFLAMLPYVPAGEI